MESQEVESIEISHYSGQSSELKTLYDFVNIIDLKSGKRLKLFCRKCTFAIDMPVEFENQDLNKEGPLTELFEEAT